MIRSSDQQRPGTDRRSRRQVIPLLSIALVLGLIAIPAAQGQAEFLKGDDLRATLAGHTLLGKGWVEFYEADGTIRGKTRMFGVRSYVGRWTVDADKVCYDYEGTAYDTCSRLRLDGTTVLHFDLRGNPKNDGIASRESGNTLLSFR